jgi:PhoD-like phosphatase
MIPAIGSRETSGLPPLPEQEAAMRGIRKVNLFENRSSPWGRTSLTNVGRGGGRGAKPQDLYWQFNVLDTRQYRDEQANDDGLDPPDEQTRNPKRTLTGEEQERWLFDSLDRSSST